MSKSQNKVTRLHNRMARPSYADFVNCPGPDPGPDPGELDMPGKSDNMSDMRKVTAREFQKRFGQLARELAEGQTVQVTNHGKPVGLFTKIAPRRPKTPDFLANLQETGCEPKLGDQILQEFNAGLS